MPALLPLPVVRPTNPDDTIAPMHTSDTATTYAVSRGARGGTEPTVATVTLPPATAVHGFTSGWGTEYEPTSLDPAATGTLRVTSGRSGQGAVPWLGVDTGQGAYVITLHWSGNWRITHTPGAHGSAVQVGLDPRGQQVRLDGAETFTLPEVSIAWGADLTDASAALARHLLGQTPPGPPPLTEWNHWWPYEDAEIDEDTFLANAAIAGDLGLDVALLDAGWFGDADAGSDWYEQRGDWHRVNTARFPHGLAWLAEQTRQRGVAFGIWLEGEAIGTQAGTARDRPDLIATGPDGEALGYVCLGSPAGWNHILDTTAGLVRETGARWLKWDFNLDPGAGCTRSDHGHHADDGLLRHYLGLYALLDRLRTEFPDLVLEGCSSGGLRIDAGLAAHVDALFLSDPDWTEHALCCTWGAARMLPARQLYHWPQSEWRGEHRFQHVDYSGTLITRQQFDTKIRAAVLHRFGLSIRLPEIRPDLRERLREHITGFREVIAPLLTDGVLVPLTDQPLREERGHRQPSFQLVSGARSIVAGFRLPRAGDWQPVRPRHLEPDGRYEVRLLDGADLGQPTVVTGAELGRTGLRCPEPGATSVIWLLTRIDRVGGGTGG